MEESEEESSDEEMELDADDPQKLVRDDEDQKYLDSLPELEREAILAERFEKMKNEADMKRALRESKRKEREERRAVKAATAKKQRKPRKAKAKADTSQDAEVAAALGSSRESGGRNRDATGVKSKKAAALADLRVRRKATTFSLFKHHLTISIVSSNARVSLRRRKMQRTTTLTLVTMTPMMMMTTMKRMPLFDGTRRKHNRSRHESHRDFAKLMTWKSQRRRTKKAFWRNPRMVFPLRWLKLI
jgi:hypothetical protein